MKKGKRLYAQSGIWNMTKISTALKIQVSAPFFVHLYCLFTLECLLFKLQFIHAKY